MESVSNVPAAVQNKAIAYADTCSAEISSANVMDGNQVPRNILKAKK